ncbi:hypothetical protein FRB99_005726 [Tulasnella sp. 403]|nr:hypothetical protein FRB99_005726 [Tulasnella sp. 403]
MSSTSSGPNNTLGLTPRPQTPPYYLSFSARNVIPPDFTAFRPKDVKAQSTIKEPVMQCSWNADGHRLATCGHEKVVRLWMPEKTLNPKETTATSGGHGAIATSVAWSPKHPELFCSSSETEKSMVFWDARKKGPTFQLKTPTPLTQLQYCPDGESVALLDKSFHLHRLQLNKLPAGEDSWELTDPSLSTVESITDFKFNHPGDLIFASSKSGSIHCVEYPSMNVIEIFNAHFGACNTLDLDPRGRFMATGGSDGMINIFNNVEVVIHKAINVTE